MIETARRRARALAEQDWTVVREQLHPDFVYTTASGHRLDRDEYLEFLEHGPLRWHEQRLDVATLVVEGDVAVLAGEVVDDVTMGAERRQLRFVTTQVYVRRDGEWVYLAGHTAAAPTP